jgi:hypothetical protein
MGSFYVNITLRGPDQGQVVAVLARLARTAAVSPTVDGFTVIYDQACDTQETGIISQLADSLSTTLSCPALAVLNHDDDILWYQLYESGQLADEYDSCPDYFGGDDPPAGPRGGDANKLCELRAGADAGAVEEILRGDYLFEIERHEDLAEALGLPEFAVGLGYDYLRAGTEPLDVERGEFVWLEKGERVEGQTSTLAEPSPEPEEASSVDGLLDEGVQNWIRGMGARPAMISAQDAVEIARGHLKQEQTPQASYPTHEAWLLPRSGDKVWLIILIPSTPGTPSWAVYVDASTGAVGDSRPLLKRR